MFRRIPGTGPSRVSLKYAWTEARVVELLLRSDVADKHPIHTSPEEGTRI